jgi:hypothetical protein
MDSLDWSRKFEVLSISRLYLHHALGFSFEAVQSLTDEDMQAIADTVRDNILFVAGMSFDEEVRFLVACEIVEQNSTGGQS